MCVEGTVFYGAADRVNANAKQSCVASLVLDRIEW